MTTRGALRERMGLLAELRQIVQAMKNLAFAELQRCAHAAPALAAARGAVLESLNALPSVGDPGPGPDRLPATWLVIGTERGFCGAFNARLAQACVQLMQETPKLRLLAAGRCLRGLLEDGGAAVEDLPGCAASDEAPACLEAWLTALAPELRGERALWLLHTGRDGLVREQLLPRPESVQPVPLPNGPAPLLQLPVETVRTALRRQAVRLLLHSALRDSLEQENHGRLNQMQRAQDHLDELGGQLRRRHASLRQSEITDELETLMSSLDGATA